MTLKTLTCYQPECDADGCHFCMTGDVEYHYANVERATEEWREYDGYTDGTVWICGDHILLPHAFVGANSELPCERCALDDDEHEVAS